MSTLSTARRQGKADLFNAASARELARAALDADGEFAALEASVLEGVRLAAADGQVSVAIKPDALGRLARPGHALQLLRRRLETLGFAVEITHAPVGGSGPPTVVVSW